MLQLDDVGTEDRELIGRKWPSQHMGDVDDSDALERTHCQIASQLYTSRVRSSGVRLERIAGSRCSAMRAGVHPSPRCMMRIGRWLIVQIDLVAARAEDLAGYFGSSVTDEESGKLRHLIGRSWRRGLASALPCSRARSRSCG